MEASETIKFCIFIGESVTVATAKFTESMRGITADLNAQAEDYRKKRESASS